MFLHFYPESIVILVAFMFFLHSIAINFSLISRFSRWCFTLPRTPLCQSFRLGMARQVVVKLVKLPSICSPLKHIETHANSSHIQSHQVYPQGSPKISQAGQLPPDLTACRPQLLASSAGGDLPGRPTFKQVTIPRPLETSIDLGVRRLLSCKCSLNPNH